MTNKKSEELTIWQRIDKLSVSSYMQYTNKKTRMLIDAGKEEIEIEGVRHVLTLEGRQLYYKPEITQQNA